MKLSRATFGGCVRSPKPDGQQPVLLGFPGGRKLNTLMRLPRPTVIPEQRRLITSFSPKNAPSSHSPTLSRAFSRYLDTNSSTLLRDPGPSDTSAEGSSFPCSLSHGMDSGPATSPPSSAKEGTPSPAGSTEASATSATTHHSASTSMASMQRSRASER